MTEAVRPDAVLAPGEVDYERLERGPAKPAVEDRLKCSTCGFVAKSPLGLAGHQQKHVAEAKRGEKPARPARKESTSEQVAEARAWIEATVQPGLLQVATFAGIPREYLAVPNLDPETGVPISWPGQPTPVGKAVQLDDTAVTVYAYAYVYGRDTWLATYLEEYGRKLLPIGLAVAVAWVSFQHIAKVATLARVVQQQQAAMAGQQAAAQADAGAA